VTAASAVAFAECPLKSFLSWRRSGDIDSGEAKVKGAAATRGEKERRKVNEGSKGGGRTRLATSDRFNKKARNEK
jgi:hypothetical protein